MSSNVSETPRAGLALSFANLVFLRVWFDLLAERSTYAKHGVGLKEYGAAIFNVLVLAAVAWCAMRFASRLPVWLRTLLTLVGVFLCVNAARAVAASYLPLLRSGAFRFLSPTAVVLAAGCAALAGGFVLFRYSGAATFAMKGVLFACLPIVPIEFVTAATRVATGPAIRQDFPLTARLTPPRRDVRVVWVIFDEWDYRLSFVSRPKGVALPALDELAARSFMGTNVLGPQGRIPVESMATQAAIPALLAGKARTADSFESPNLFTQAHTEGWNVAIGGWYIPYCRVFAHEAYRCYWDQMYRQSTEEAASFAGTVKIQSRSLFETSMFSLFGQSLTSELHAKEYRSILDFALAAEADPDAGLVFLHFNIPHAPYFYDAKSGRFDAPGRGMVAAYGDALVLLDRTVEKLEQRLDSNTVLILSADHPLRNAGQIDGVTDPRVPFLIHFPGQVQPWRESAEFSSIETAPLILEILNRGVRTPAEAAQMLLPGSHSENARGER
jgi:hypothetical protein